MRGAADRASYVAKADERSRVAVPSAGALPVPDGNPRRA